MNSYEVYCFYLALRQHFTSTNYDFFRYNGRVSATVESFEKRKDIYYFKKIKNHRNPKGFILANILVDPNRWIGEFSDDAFLDWEKRTQSLKYLYQQDLQQIDSAKDWLLPDEGTKPKLFTSFGANEIMLETMVILNIIFKYTTRWDKRIEFQYDPLWTQYKILIEKYTPFIRKNIDVSEYTLETKKIISSK